LGFDVELTRSVAEAVSVPVIASGGGWEPHHFVEVFVEGKADAGLAASIFHRKIWNLSELKMELARSGIHVRTAQGG
ncbi:MAG TPA: imidazole glycerol phosphate synthase subunit HisF, partial [Proteobacteria bacterium]|nr:imidazole glycerol phosphate synthase subunit HisF [Pseudomonadota bacterium]